MAKKLIVALTAIVLGICLLSGGCSNNQGADRVQQLRDLLQQALKRNLLRSRPRALRICSLKKPRHPPRKRSI